MLHLTPEEAAIARKQGRCPLCGANWPIIGSMLADKSNAEDWLTASCIVQSCSCCQAHFGQPPLVMVALPSRRQDG